MVNRPLARRPGRGRQGNSFRLLDRLGSRCRSCGGIQRPLRVGPSAISRAQDDRAAARQMASRPVSPAKLSCAAHCDDPFPLERLGAASLPVFCSHLVSVLVVLALVGDKQGSTSLPVELALLAATFSVMFAASTKFRLRAKSKNDPAPPDREIAVSARGGR